VAETGSKAAARVLVVRNDKLGDFMLALPSFALLKASLPEAEVMALVPEYTREIALACPWIDEVLIDPAPARGHQGTLALARRLREARIDAGIALFSTSRTALALWLARIPLRLAPATKLAQLLYTHRLRQRRSRSEQPEYAYNLDLIHAFLEQRGAPACTLPGPPYLELEGDATELRAAFCAERGLDPARPLVFVHPGSGGSANNLSAAQYHSLAATLLDMSPAQVVISAGPGERDPAEAVLRDLPGARCTLYHSTEGLRRFAEHIRLADAFVSGSTGPLHIAGALDRPTAAFYPRRRSATALRWQTLSRADRRLAFTPPGDSAEEDMGAIDVTAAARAIVQTLL
jgi:ADP-heptose:LPS heptosyltransferase